MIACKAEIEAVRTTGAEDSTKDPGGTRRIVLSRDPSESELARLTTAAEADGYSSSLSGRTFIMVPKQGHPDCPVQFRGSYA